MTAPGGGIAVVTFFRGRNPSVDIFAVHMLLNSRGGDTHPESDYRRWLGEAGFSVLDIVDVAGEATSALFATRNEQPSPG